MSTTYTGFTPNAYREFINTVANVSKESLQEKPEIAGWLSFGLTLAAQGAEGASDSMGSATAGP